MAVEKFVRIFDSFHMLIIERWGRYDSYDHTKRQTCKIELAEPESQVFASGFGEDPIFFPVHLHVWLVLELTISCTTAASQLRDHVRKYRRTLLPTAIFPAKLKFNIPVQTSYIHILTDIHTSQSDLRDSCPDTGSGILD